MYGACARPYTPNPLIKLSVLFVQRVFIRHVITGWGVVNIYIYIYVYIQVIRVRGRGLSGCCPHSPNVVCYAKLMPQPFTESRTLFAFEPPECKADDERIQERQQKMLYVR